MWATLPLFIFFSLLIMGQSSAYNYFDCATEAFIQQVCYYQVRNNPRPALALHQHWLVLSQPPACPIAYRPICGKR